uniref:Uncharacterized protein n=1 Tax=Oryza glaberrima TaxID=4538 RepID=I1QS47_ORYGL
MKTFSARRSRAELVAPSRPTPRDTKILSDLDDFPNHHEYTPELFFRVSGDDDQPPPPDQTKWATTVFRTALAEALVYLYPMAGRLRMLPSGKLAVDCTEEGVVLVAAEADLRLADLGEPLLPPFPCVGELVCHNSIVGDIRVVLGKPLVFLQIMMLVYSIVGREEGSGREERHIILHISQKFLIKTNVTEFKCGGFAIGLHMNHCIADGFGLTLFVKAIADLARGEPRPLALPVWERHLLMVRAPPSVAAAYPAFKPLIDGGASSGNDDVMLTTPLDTMVTRHFLFGRREMAALRRHLPAHLSRRCTDFELLAAVLWRCRTAALFYAPHRQVCLDLPSNASGRRMRRRHGVHVPEGYYGNALAYTIVHASAGELCGGTLGHTVEVVCEAKLRMTEEYVRSTVDLLVSLRQRGRALVFDGVFVVSDATRLVGELDFGRGGEWVGAGVAQPMRATFLVRCRDADGEDAVAASMLLPPPAMDKFAEDIAEALLITSRL